MPNHLLTGLNQLRGEGKWAEGDAPDYEADKARHDKMVELVTRMLDLKRQQSRAPKKQSPSTGTRSSFIGDSLIVEHRNSFIPNRSSSIVKRVGNGDIRNVR
jgi:hypothetical protein